MVFDLSCVFDFIAKEDKIPKPADPWADAPECGLDNSEKNAESICFITQVSVFDLQFFCF